MGTILNAMKFWRNIILFLFITSGLLASFTACSSGHLGSNEIAFLRDGRLWTIDPNGQNAFAVVDADTPVVNYAWSPTHQILFFQALDSDFAKTAKGKQVTHVLATVPVGDVPSTANTIGIDGGSPIPIAFSSLKVHYSNAIWTGDGSRLLYRVTNLTRGTSPLDVGWYVSQNDQPGGIAQKTLPASFSIPSLSYERHKDQQYLILGNDDHGVFTTTITGQNQQRLTDQALAGHPLMASLERLLWRPQHHDQSFLYAVPQSTEGNLSKVQLLLQTLQPAGQQPELIASCTCTQFAWSPDGNTILYTTGTTYTLFNLVKHTSWEVTAEAGSVPYWSPDSHFLILDGLHSLSLLTIDTEQQQNLLSDIATNESIQETVTANQSQASGTNVLLQPTSNSIWASDNRHFLFLTHNRLSWQKQRLASGDGIYNVNIDNHGRVLSRPTSVMTGKSLRQPGWSASDPNTSFLF